MGTVMVDSKRPLRERYHKVVHMVIKDVENLRLELPVATSVFPTSFEALQIHPSTLHNPQGDILVVTDLSMKAF